MFDSSHERHNVLSYNKIIAQITRAHFQSPQVRMQLRRLNGINFILSGHLCSITLSGYFMTTYGLKAS